MDLEKIKELLDYIESNEPLSDEECKELINLVTNLTCP